MYKKILDVRVKSLISRVSISAYTYNIILSYFIILVSMGFRKTGNRSGMLNKTSSSLLIIKNYQFCWNIYAVVENWIGGF